MADSRFAIAELEAEMAAEYRLQALAARHDVDARCREADTAPEPRDGAEPLADIDIDPWRPLFEGE